MHNLLELTRVYVSAEDTGIKFSYLLIYLVLIAYTCIFIWKYLKRFIMMAFLTMIAPIIAFTYPIDKMKDGQAQAFNAWFREYLFNALLQPLHLIIYMVLIGSAISLAQSNVIYAIVALAFISQSEKLLRSFFGFDRAKTAGGDTGAFAKGALASQAISRLRSGSKASSTKTSDKSNNSKSGGSKPRTANLSAYLGGNGGGNSVPTSDVEGVAPGIDTSPITGIGGPTSTPEDPHLGSKEPGSHEYAMAAAAAANNEEMPYSQRLNEIPDTFKDSENNTNKDKEDAYADKLGKVPKTFKDNDKDKKPIQKLQTKDAKLNKPNKPKEKKKIKGPYQHTRKRAVAGMVGKAIKYTAPKVGRGAIRTAAAMSGAMIGGAMAIATGNASYLAAGALAGSALGGKVANAPKALGNVGRSIRTAYRAERLGGEGAKDKARFEEFKKDKENIKYFKDKYNLSSNKEAKAMIDQGREFIEAGYTDVEDVDRLMKMKNASGGSATSEQIMAADQMASKLKLEDLMDSDKSAKLENSIAKQMQYQAQAQGQNISAAKARSLAQEHMNSMRVSKGLPVQENKQYVPTKAPKNDKQATRREAAKHQSNAAAKVHQEKKQAREEGRRLNPGSNTAPQQTRGRRLNPGSNTAPKQTRGRRPGNK